MEIAIISDTHMPRRGRRLPDGCVERLRRADAIVHAGDFSRMSVLHELELYGELVGVHGNVDDEQVRRALPHVRELELADMRIVVIHDAGPRLGRLERLRARHPSADAVIFGHSHMPLHERAADGFQIFNPGSPTERRRSPAHTMGIAKLRDGRVTFELVTLG